MGGRETELCLLLSACRLCQFLAEFVLVSALLGLCRALRQEPRLRVPIAGQQRDHVCKTTAVKREKMVSQRKQMMGRGMSSTNTKQDNKINVLFSPYSWLTFNAEDVCNESYREQYQTVHPQYGENHISCPLRAVESSPSFQNSNAQYD